jgi:hypothetical protein
LWLPNPNLSPSPTKLTSDGRTIEAEFIELKDSKVGLLMTGKRYDVPLDSLSEEDQSYAKSESQRRIEKANAEARQFMGQELKPGELLIFTFSLSDENQRKSRGRTQNIKICAKCVIDLALERTDRRLRKEHIMDAELLNELKDSIRQMKAIEAGELAPTKVRIVNPEQVRKRA